jgi:hypothetical protein
MPFAPPALDTIEDPDTESGPAFTPPSLDSKETFKPPPVWAKEPPRTSAFKQFFPALFDQTDEQKQNLDTVKTAQARAKAADLSPRDIAANAQAVSDKWNRILEMAGESRPENVPALTAQRDAELRQAGVEPLYMGKPVELPKMTPEDVHQLFPKAGKRAVAAIQAGQNVAAGIGEGYLSPEGVAMFGPNVGPVISRAFVAQMGLSIPENLGTAAGHYDAGDYEAGDQALIEAGTTMAMLGVPLLAGKGKVKAPEETPNIERAETAPPSVQPEAPKAAPAAVVEQVLGKPAPETVKPPSAADVEKAQAKAEAAAEKAESPKQKAEIEKAEIPAQPAAEELIAQTQAEAQRQHEAHLAELNKPIGDLTTPIGRVKGETPHAVPEPEAGAPPVEIFSDSDALAALATLKGKAAQAKLAAAAPVLQGPREQEVLSAEEQARIKAARDAVVKASQPPEAKAEIGKQKAETWKPPKADTVEPVPAQPLEDVYTLTDAVREAGGLTGPDLDQSLAVMRKGATAAQVVAQFDAGGAHDTLAYVLEQIAAARDDGNAGEYRRLRKAYQRTFGAGQPKADLILQGIMQAGEEGRAPEGGVPESEGELIDRAWDEASAAKAIDREATAAAQEAADFEAFNQSLRVTPTAVMSGDMVLAEIHQGKNGRKHVIPTEEGARLGPAYQNQVLAVAGVQAEHGMEAGGELPGMNTGQRPVPQGFDATILRHLTAVAGNIIKGGKTDFASYAQAMNAALDGEYQPYYHAAYNQVREFTEAAHLKARMTPREEIESYDSSGRFIGGPAAAGGGPELSGTVGGAGRPRRPGLRVVDEGDLPTPRPIVRSGEYTGPRGAGIDETQRYALNSALTAFEAGKAAYLLGDGTGVGKTGTELAVAHQMHLKTKLPSLIVTQSRPIIENRFRADQVQFGIPSQGTEFITYDDLSRGKVPKGEYGVAIFDEAHNLKRKGSNRQVYSELIRARHKVFATATPMDSPTHAAYFLAELTGRSREQVAKDLGYHFEERLTEGQTREYAVLDKDMSWHAVTDNIKRLRNVAVKAGQFLRREFPFFGRAAMRDAPGFSADQLKEQAAIEKYWDAQIHAAKSPMYRRNLSGQKTLELSRWAEIQKLPWILEAVMEDLARGKHVIVYGEGYRPTMIKGAGKMVPGILGELARELDRRGIRYAKVFEDSPEEKGRAAALFQRGEAKVLLATPRSGGAGLDMDDQIGNQPRVAHAATLNFAADVFDQMLGRVSRRNTASPADFHVWTNRESYSDRRRMAVADRKLRTLRNIQSGEDLDVSEFERGAEAEAIHGMDADEPFALEPPENMDQQRERRAQAEAEAEALAKRQRMEQQAAAKLKGTAGDLGQKDMFAAPGDLWTPAAQQRRPTGEAEHGMAGGDKAESRKQKAEMPAKELVAQGPAAAEGLIKDLQTFRAAAAPQSLSGPARFAADVLRQLGAQMANELARADKALRPFRNDFDRTPLPKGWKYNPGLPLPRNLAFVDAYEGGTARTLGPQEATLAAEFRSQNEVMLDRVHALGKGALKTWYENYFPHIWDRPDKARHVIAQFLAKQPLEGSKAFLKQRTYKLFTEALAAGLKPLHDNPVDLWMLKRREVERFILGVKFVEIMKGAGFYKHKFYSRPMPEGWATSQDPAFRSWGQPVVTLKEAFDADMRERMLEGMEGMGIPHKRLVAIGGKRWGFEKDRPGTPGTERIVTKFAGPEFVLFHELGHALDNRYADFRERLNATKGMENQLRALADLRFEGQTASESFKREVRSMPEKMAVALQAYMHAPERMAQVAPAVKGALESFLSAHKELAWINDVKPSLRLGSAEAQKKLPGFVRLGDWIMPEGAVYVVDNYLRPGLQRFAMFRGFREASNLLNGIQLVGGFHLGFVTGEAPLNKMALAARDASKGYIKLAGRAVASAPLAPLSNLYRGYLLRKESLQPGSVGGLYAEAVKNLEAGGFRFSQDPFWRTQFTRRSLRALSQAWTQLKEPGLQKAYAFTETGKALANLPWAVIEQAMRPVMEYFVPWQKAGAAMEMLGHDMITENPQSPEALRAVARRVSDSIDNRMGQMAYDNRFINKTAKDAALLSFRAFGWQLGKYQELGGGALDLGKLGWDAGHGRWTGLSHRTAYMLALPIGVGLAGAMLNFLMTGQTPQEWRDYYMPRTGRKDAMGNDVRISLPTYMKDVIAYGRHPLVAFGHSLNPFLSSLVDLWNNRDFYNTQIRTADENMAQKIWADAKFMGAQGKPFFLTGMAKMAESGTPLEQRTAAFFGFMPASRQSAMTPAESLAADIMQDMMPQGARTPDQAQRSQLTAQLVKDLRTGKINDEGVLVERLRGAGATTRAAQTVLAKRVTWTPLEYQVSKMSVEQAMRVWDLASEQEKVQLASCTTLNESGGESPVLLEKIKRAYKGGKLDAAETGRLVKMVVPYLKQSPKPTVQSRPGALYKQ